MHIEEQVLEFYEHQETIKLFGIYSEIIEKHKAKFLKGEIEVSNEKDYFSFKEEVFSLFENFNLLRNKLKNNTIVSDFESAKNYIYDLTSILSYIENNRSFSLEELPIIMDSIMIICSYNDVIGSKKVHTKKTKKREELERRYGEASRIIYEDNELEETRAV